MQYNNTTYDVNYLFLQHLLQNCCNFKYKFAMEMYLISIAKSLPRHCKRLIICIFQVDVSTYCARWSLE